MKGNYTDSPLIDMAELRASVVNNYNTLRLEILNDSDFNSYKVPEEFMGPKYPKY